MTLRVYAHAMREEENDLSFAELSGGAKRLYPAPAPQEGIGRSPKCAESMVRREGFEPPTLRFEERREAQGIQEVAL